MEQKNVIPAAYCGPIVGLTLKVLQKIYCHFKIYKPISVVNNLVQMILKMLFFTR